MVFSSLLFLFLFLPVVLIFYYITPDRYRNYILLFASLFFYAWGEPRYVYLMAASIAVNYAFGLKVDKSFGKYKKAWLALSVFFNLSTLLLFKYGDFILGIEGIALPLGISFFTFQTMSYVIDVYRKDAKVQRNVSDLALYISLFPQLVAGPIVRYQSVYEQINERSHTLDKFAVGVHRFVIGLSKKVIVANQLALVADGVFQTSISDTSVLESWIGILAYSLQIYFDFSGYSDMAIGLGKMFGLDFLENFNYPYISQSISEFWRRWHISLGSWFKDYLYIPLGGNRVSKLMVYRNLFVVWFLTGLWHGADWTFIAWGLYYGIFISLEKAFLESWLKKLPRAFRHAYLILVVMTGWVFFRAEDIVQGLSFLKVMSGISGNELISSSALKYINDFWYIIALGVLFSTPAAIKIKELLSRTDSDASESRLAYIAHSLSLAVCLILVTILLSGSSYNPFLYFRF